MGFWNRLTRKASATVQPVNNKGNAVKNAAENTRKVFAAKRVLYKLKEIDELKYQLSKLVNEYSDHKTKNFDRVKNDKVFGPMLAKLGKLEGDFRHASSKNIESSAAIARQELLNRAQRLGSATRRAISGTAASLGRAVATGAVSSASALGELGSKVYRRGAELGSQGVIAVGQQFNKAGTFISSKLGEAHKSILSAMPSAKAKELLGKLQKAKNNDQRRSLKEQIISEIDRARNKRFFGISQNKASKLRKQVTNYTQNLNATNNTSRRRNAAVGSNNLGVGSAGTTGNTDGTTGNTAGTPGAVTPRAQANAENGHPIATKGNHSDNTAHRARVVQKTEQGKQDGGGRTRRNRRYRKH